MLPDERIKQAFLHLEFAVKVMRYFESGRVRKADFDIETPIVTPVGRTSLSANSFHTDRDLILGGQNVYSTTLGVCAIALESALIDHGVKNDPALNSPEGTLRSFIYQLRNAFAHDAMQPKWSAKGPYARTYDLTPVRVPVTIDLGALNGQPLDLAQFGYFQGLLAVRDAVTRWVTAGSPL